MLQGEYRFHRRGHVSRVYRLGKATHGNGLTIRYLKTKRPKTRVAVSISSKVSKSAVKRNRIRRRIYELFRKNWDTIAQGYDMVVVVKHEELAKLPSTEVEKRLFGCLDSADLLN